MDILRDILTPRTRAIVYAVFAVVGLVLGAIQVGFGAAEVSQPVWLVVAFAVYGFLGGATGLAAASNTDTTKHEE